MAYSLHVNNLMYYSNKCQLLASGKRGEVCESFILKPVNNDGNDTTGDEIEIYVRIMDSVHY